MHGMVVTFMLCFTCQCSWSGYGKHIFGKVNKRLGLEAIDLDTYQKIAKSRTWHSSLLIIFAHKKQFPSYCGYMDVDLQYHLS